MNKNTKITLKLDLQTGLEILQVLDTATHGYSKDFVPDRVVRLRKAMNELSDKLSESLIS